MFEPETFQDAFNLLCDTKLGHGIHRTTFLCRFDPDLVVKVEHGEHRNFSNIIEWRIWNDFQHVKSVARWLAPCRYLSPDGRLLVQERAAPLRRHEIPAKVPSFLNDEKPSNFGMINRRVVCVDYAGLQISLSDQLVERQWSHVDVEAS